MKKNQYGFSRIALLALIVLVAVLALGTYILMVKDRAHRSDASISSFAQCKARGKPITGSYPEQCSANGKTFTNLDQKTPVAPVAVDATSNWFLYDSKSFTVRLPDGWQLIHINNAENIYGHTASQIRQKRGMNATVTAQNEGGWDGPSAFTLYLPEQNYDQIVRQGTEIGTIKAASGQLAHKYYYVQKVAEDGPGYQKGDKVYGYYFDVDGKYIQISHTVGSVNSIDQHETVESIIKTLMIK